MSRESLTVVRWLLALAALCIVAITVLDILQRKDPEVLTILGGVLATIVGAVAGVVVGQKISGGDESLKARIAELEAMLAEPAPAQMTGPDLGEHLGMYQGETLTNIGEDGVPVDLDGDGEVTPDEIARFYEGRKWGA